MGWRYQRQSPFGFTSGLDKEDQMKKKHHPIKPRRVKRKKGIVSRVISGSTKAVSKAWS